MKCSFQELQGMVATLRVNSQSAQQMPACNRVFVCFRVVFSREHRHAGWCGRGSLWVGGGREFANAKDEVPLWIGFAVCGSRVNHESSIERTITRVSPKTTSQAGCLCRQVMHANHFVAMIHAQAKRRNEQ